MTAHQQQMGSYGECGSDCATPQNWQWVALPGLWSGSFDLALTGNGQPRLATHAGGTVGYRWPPRAVASPTEGLVAYYPFDGHADDLSGFGNHGTAQRDLTYEAGVFGEAAYFNGVNSFIWEREIPVPRAPSPADKHHVCP